MENGPTIARRSVTIVNAKGLHMRPATRFVKLASTFRSAVSVTAHDSPVNGKSILDMTSLAAECGTTIELEARGDDAEAAVAALVDLVEAGFHMDEEAA